MISREGVNPLESQRWPEFHSGPISTSALVYRALARPLQVPFGGPWRGRFCPRARRGHGQKMEKIEKYGRMENSRKLKIFKGKCKILHKSVNLLRKKRRKSRPSARKFQSILDQFLEILEFWKILINFGSIFWKFWKIFWKTCKILINF